MIPVFDEGIQSPTKNEQSATSFCIIGSIVGSDFGQMLQECLVRHPKHLLGKLIQLELQHQVSLEK